MRYIFTALSIFTIMLLWPSFSRAEDSPGQLAAGSKPAKETPGHYIPPGGRDRTDGGDHGRPGRDANKPRGKGGHQSDRSDRNRPTGASAVDQHKLNYGATPTDSLRYGVIKSPEAVGKATEEPQARPKRRDRKERRHGSSWGYDCYPYCVGAGLWYDYEDWSGDKDDNSRYVQPVEPERPFQSGGVFEPFDDPRDHPAYDDGYPRYSGGAAGQNQPTDYDVDQYRMMMRAWQ